MITFKLTVEYICNNICTEEDLKNKSPREIFNELLEGEDYYRLFCDKPQIKKIEVIKETNE